MTDKDPDVESVASSQAQDTLPSVFATSVAVLDRKTVQALFVALRTAIPAEVRQTLLRDSLEELKFLLARQPRLSSFHHRRRESLRHPALAMATKNYYQLCRRKRIELAVQAVAAEQEQQQGRPRSKRGDAPDGQADRTDTMAVQRDAELVDLLLAEYAKSGGFQEDYGWFNHHSNNNNNINIGGLGESSRFNASVSFGSRGFGGMTAQLMSSTSAVEMRSEASLSVGELRTGGNTNAAGMSGVWRSGQPITHYGNSINNNTPLADSTGVISPVRLGQSFTGSNVSNPNDGGAGGHPGSRKGVRGTPGGAGRFFSKRHDRAEGVGVSGRVGGGRGDSGVRWGAETHAMVIRRADEELHAGSGGDPYLLTSSRPIEVLLTCYGGVQRDSAVMAMGAASLLMGVDNFAAAATTTPTDADPLFNAVVEEDVRWDQLAQCYRQLLHEADAVRQAAATVVAHDALVNDIIRRFWDRLTVSAAAQQAHKSREATRKRDAVADATAFTKRVYSGLIMNEADEDDLDEIQVTNDKDGDAFDVGVMGSRSGTRDSLRAAKDASDGVAAGSRKGTNNSGSGGGKGKRKRKKAVVTSFSTKAAEPASTVAFYMTPLQYVYLHTRLAHVLLPDSNALDMELLYFIQEDLLVDAAYSESDAAQTLYFGEAPRLVALSSSGGATTGTGGTMSHNVERRQTGKDRFALWPEDDNTSGDDDGQQGPSLCQRFLAVRRHGYALSEDGGVSNQHDDNISVLVRHPTAISFGGGASEDGSSSHRGGGNNNSTSTVDNDGKSKQAAMNALSLVKTCFNISELPSLTYQQFWCSMMELADNWTCCAGHPVETAIFLWELYAEVFGHNWDTEDEALATALGEKAATVSKSECANIDEEVADALRSFHDLVKALRVHEKEGRPSSTSGLSGGFNVPLGGDFTFPPGGSRTQRRRNRGLRKSTNPPRVDPDRTSTWDSSSSSDSDVSLTEWNALAVGENRIAGEWVYLERVDKDGVKRRFRRRVMHRQPRRRNDVDHANGGSQGNGDGDVDGDEELSFILEEELDDDGAIVKQWKRRCKAVVAQAKQRRRMKLHGGSSSTTVSTAALYERRRKYEEDNAKQLRRLETRRRVEGGSSHGSSLTSWGSFDDGTTEERCNGRRRRPRIRRTGQRRHRLLARTETDGDGASSVISDSDSGGKSKAGTEGGAGKDKSATKLSLTPEELAELRANKDWLCSVLGAKGISLPPHMFDDPSERVLLYELLRLTKESEARGGSGVDGSGQGGDDILNFGDGEGSDVTDLSRLAALLAQSAAFNLDGLDDSALMRRLLGEGEGRESQFLSPHQLQSILLALAKGQKPAEGGISTPAAETESVRARRLRLLHMLEERQAREQQEQLREDASETALPLPMAPSVSLPSPISLPTSAHSLHSPSIHNDKASEITTSAAAGASAATAAVEASAHRIPTPPPPKPPKPPMNADDSEWVLSPSTAAERREQERLFREFEAYWSDRASQHGRYRVHITEYTKEQLNEFFAHLHLGPRQRALLRGRAPLAAASSLVGGTLHQDTLQTNKLDSSSNQRGSGAAVSAPSLVPVAAAPVKLFTLTTEASLDSALRESYQSYLTDRTFSRTCKDAVYATRQQGQQLRRLGSNLHPLLQSGRVTAKNSTLRTYGGVSPRSSITAAVAATPSTPAAPLPSHGPSKLPPVLAGPSTRRNQPSLSANLTSSLPKV